MKNLALVFTLFLFSLASCVNAQSVNVETFEAGLTPEVQLLDVRTQEEFEEGHLKGALRADVNNEAEFEKVIGQLDKEKPVYVYCRSGKRSSEAAEILKGKGFIQVVDLDGGILAWEEEGKPVE